VVKAVRACGGDAALKKLAAAAEPGAGVGSRPGKKASSSKGSSSAAQEAAATATALLGLIALTKEVLARSRRDARAGAAHARGRGGSSSGCGEAEIEEEDAEDAEEDAEEDDDDDREDEEDDRKLAAARAAGFATYASGSDGSGGAGLAVRLDDDSGADEWGGDESDNAGSGPAILSGLVTVAPASDRKGRRATLSPGPSKVEVRRLGPGRGHRSDGSDFKDGEGEEGVLSDESGEEARLAGAMAALERDLGLVQLTSAAEAGQPKRGWTAAWGV
jgi:hypothetical protein